MEGFIFYWIFWFGWVWTTFMYPKKHPERLIISAWILAVIILSGVSLPLHSRLYLSGSGAFIMLTAYIYSATLETKKTLYFVITSFILMLITVCFLLYELFDPVWILIKREWLLSLLVVYVAILLHSDKKQRILSMMLGLIQGEIFYAVILMKYSFSYPVAAPASLDVIALAAALIIAWNCLELIAGYFDKHLHSGEKEKHKIT